jgi:hypothetical protein
VDSDQGYKVLFGLHPLEDKRNSDIDPNKLRIFEYLIKCNRIAVYSIYVGNQNLSKNRGSLACDVAAVGG